MSIDYENTSRGTDYRPATPDLTIDPYLEVPAYHLEDMTMEIHDVVWGKEKIGDQPYDELLINLARTPLFRRVQAVEQLTLPPEFSTIPNTSHFSRWQHLWGGVVFIRKMTRDDDRFSDRDKIVLQLRALLSDIGQTAFSHLGDWIFQENGSGEDLHDQELRSLLEEFNVDTLIEEYGITLNEVVFPDKQDFVECDPPNICTDRLDYGLREILRWVSHPLAGGPSKLFLYDQQLKNPQKLFKINDDMMLEITDQKFAKTYATAHNLLSTEHHMQPAHRLQLLLMQTAVKSALLDGQFPDGIFIRNDIHPRDRLYGVDSDFRFAFADWDRVILSETMKGIGLSQRRIFKYARRHDLSYMLHQDEFPDPLQPYTWQSNEYGLVAPNIEIEGVSELNAAVKREKYGLRFNLGPLKPRSIDPLVTTTNGSVPLSKLDKNFERYRADQAIYTGMGYSALLLVNSVIAKNLSEMFKKTNDQWPERASQPRNSRDLKDVVEYAQRAGAAHRFDIITDW